MVDLKSMGECADLAGEGEGAQTSPMASGGRGRVNRERERERVREWARGGWRAVRDFNAAYMNGQGQARRSARGGDRRTSVLEWLKQGRREPSAAPSGLSARLDVTGSHQCEWLE